jgi:hypothetical protein
MILLVAAGQVSALALCLIGGWTWHRRRRSAIQVDDGWWPEFERQFRVYAARSGPYP